MLILGTGDSEQIQATTGSDSQNEINTCECSAGRVMITITRKRNTD